MATSSSLPSETANSSVRDVMDADVSLVHPAVEDNAPTDASEEQQVNTAREKNARSSVPFVKSGAKKGEPQDQARRCLASSHTGLRRGPFYPNKARVDCVLLAILESSVVFG